MIYHMFPGLDLDDTAPIQYLITAGQDLDYLDHDPGQLCQMCERFSLQRCTHRADEIDHLDPTLAF